jgi:hypothetical protein
MGGQLAGRLLGRHPPTRHGVAEPLPGGPRLAVCPLQIDPQGMRLDIGLAAHLALLDLLGQLSRAALGGLGLRPEAIARVSGLPPLPAEQPDGQHPECQPPATYPPSTLPATRRAAPEAPLGPAPDQAEQAWVPQS